MKESIIQLIRSFYLHKQNDIEVFDNLRYDEHSIYWSGGLLVLFALISIGMWFLSRLILVRVLSIWVDRSAITWDDHLVTNKVFRSLAHLVPLMFMEYFFSIIFYQYPGVKGFWSTIVNLAILMVVMVSIRRGLNALQDVIQENEKYKDKPIQSYNQVAKIVVSTFFVIAMLSLATNQSPLYFIGGMGAAAAILILVFKDTILGFIGSIQIATNDILRIGDWVTMDKFGADGEVEIISLATVKIRNFDRTITTIPTYAFISDSFKNWRGMQESDGRRIKRPIHIQIDSVKFANTELLERLQGIQLLSEFVPKRQKEIEDYNELHGFVGDKAINGRRQTNLGLFRKYAEYYLLNHPLVNQNMHLMVRQLQSTENGMPMEIYCFSKSKVWEEYEGIQADIFDHLFSVIHYFDLAVFERPTGKDFRN
ncbi:MAG: mechanosensitive ion channel domain-containing protein [Crocinitomicaceae bacterium]